MLLSTNGLSNLTLHMYVRHRRLRSIRTELLFSTDDVNKYATVLSDNLGDPEWGHSYSPTQAPFNTYTKYPDSFFAYFVGSVFTLSFPC